MWGQLSDNILLATYDVDARRQSAQGGRGMSGGAHEATVKAQHALGGSTYRDALGNALAHLLAIERHGLLATRIASKAR